MELSKKKINNNKQALDASAALERLKQYRIQMPDNHSDIMRFRAKVVKAHLAFPICRIDICKYKDLSPVSHCTHNT